MSGSRQQRRHRALASPVRARILAALRARQEPQDVRALADLLDVHVNTIRLHLGVLEDAGLASSEPEERDRPGRPRLVYRATADADAIEADDPGYRFLATILAGSLSATAEDPAATAEAAGAAWGRHLIEPPQPFHEPAPDAALDQIVAMLDDLGFAPTLERDDPTTPRMLLRRCPFLDVAKEHQDVVCSIHLGLMRGALDELGGAVTARDLLPFVEPSLCVSHLQAPA